MPDADAQKPPEPPNNDPPEESPPKHPAPPPPPEVAEIFRNSVRDVARIHDDLEQLCTNSEIGGGRGMVPATLVRKSTKDLENLFHTLRQTMDL